MGHDDDLIAARLNLEELCAVVKADSLAFLSLDGMMSAIGREDGYCNACFTGVYPVAVPAPRRKDSFEQVLA
jgi:amidophosphoribosyltransferase